MFFPVYSFLARIVYLSLSVPSCRSAFWHVDVLHFFTPLFIDFSPLGPGRTDCVYVWARIVWEDKMLLTFTGLSI